MPIHRSEHKRDFTIILNAVLNDSRLSYGARGVMAHVLTHTDSWTFSGEDYFVTTIDKKVKVRGYIKELIHLGYLKRSRQKDDKGRLGNSIYLFFEKPNLDLPNLDKPNLDKPNLEKPNLENIKQVKSEQTSPVEPNYDLPNLDMPNLGNKKQGRTEETSMVELNCDLPNLDLPNLDLPNLENMTLNNTNINNTKYIYSANDAEEIWNVYPNKKGKADYLKKIPKILKKISKEEILRCIDRYKDDVSRQRLNGFTSLNYKNGSTFFNGAYMDYLDCNFIKPKNIEDTPKKRINDNFNY